MRSLIVVWAALATAACGGITDAAWCGGTGYETLPMIETHTSPDRSRVARDTVPADPPCVVGAPWERDGMVLGVCVCMD
jgi:hypothetical protein